MNYTFFKYFFLYIFKAKTRQRLLFVAIFGLLLSSLSLIVIQGVMNGLQDGLISRSKVALGYGVLILENNSKSQVNSVFKKLDKEKVKYTKELTLEILLKNENYLSPTIIHGVDLSGNYPNFLKGKIDTGIVLASDLYSELNTFLDSKISLISPTHYDYIFGEIPRSVTSDVAGLFVSEIPEIDKVHSWVNILVVQNLIREQKVNNLRFYSRESFEKAQELLPKYDFISWEQKNQSLVWALNLETSVMIFLFICMSLLVSLSITSGYMIFFDKIKSDLLSFWVLGMSREKLSNLSLIFVQLMSFATTLLGLLAGVGILYFVSTHKISFLGDLFIEQTIPVHISKMSLLISFAIPFTISSFFSYLSYRYFKKENGDFLVLIRKIL